MARKCYSQYGQDMFAESFMIGKNLIPRDKGYSGTFIDVGCCWPVNNNNTYYFYAKGWRGLCIDPNPEMGELFAKERPDDVFANCGAGTSNEPLTYYMYSNRQHNSFHAGRAAYKADKLLGTKEIPIKRISDLIDQHIPDRQIDFLSMDVEGGEIDALQSIDLTRHRPKLLCIECIVPIETVFNNKIVKYLESKQYRLVGHTGHDISLISD